jgi:outer membrane protein assembly factor BamB
VANGIVYVGADKLYAFDGATGSVLWSATNGSSTASSPAIANGVVYIGSNDNNVYAFDAATGALLWSATTGNDVNSSPTISDGKVFVGSADLKLHAFALNAEGNAAAAHSRPRSLGY